MESAITNILTSSENTNNENREKELLGFQPNSSESTEEDDIQEGSVRDRRNLTQEDRQKDEDEKDLVAESVDSSNKDNKSDNETDTSGSTSQQENKVKEDSSKSLNTQSNDVNDEYSKHVTYNESGEAIYTDPVTKYKYRWSEDKNDWEPLEGSADAADKETNPYENEHYRWCTKTNQWIPKTKVTSDEDGKGTMETEFYKWDKETNQWIPKTQSSNVVYRSEDGVHTYTDQDGAVYFWDTDKNAWFPKIDDEFMARYQLNYGFVDNTSSGENTGIKSNNKLNTDADSADVVAMEDSLNQEDIELFREIQSSQETSGYSSSTNNKPLKRKQPDPPKWFDVAPEQNTKVYVSNLPDDITEEEFIQVMSKCGLIMRDPQTQKYKVKLYTDTNGQLKGDGLCDYIKIESVDLALKLLDGYDVRGRKIKVQVAKFQMRGEYNPALKPKKKKKEKEKLQKMKERLFDWRPEKMRGERSKHERIVIIKNLFEPELFDKEVHLIIEYQNDLREECGKCGTVRKVVIFDRHPEGVAQVTMSSPEEADLVVEMMHRRFFGQRRLLAEIWDGKTKYKIAETEAEVEKRISNWDKYLEEDDATEKGKQKKAEDSNVDTSMKVPDEKSNLQNVNSE